MFASATGWDGFLVGPPRMHGVRLRYRFEE
jgi:hypothetical protein